MKLFTNLKAWQMFMLIIVPMIVPTFIGFDWFLPIWFVWMLVLVGWYYSIGVQANAALPDHLQRNIRIYQISFTVPIVYGLLIVSNVGMPVVSPGEGQVLPAWVVPLHLGSMAGMFYGLWFTSKQFTALQRGKDVGFLEYGGSFFSFWFAPIGVWFIQPKVNELLSNK